MGFFDSFGDILGTIVAPVPYLANKLSGGALGNMLGLGGGSTPALPLLAPPPPVDATDDEIRRQVLMQRRRLLLGQGQGSSFSSGPMGDMSAVSTTKSSAGGF